MNPSDFINVIFIVIVMTPRVEYATARRHTINPGERWLNTGDNLTVKCNLTRKLCNSSTRRKIFRFQLKGNHAQYKGFIRRRITEYCNGSVAVMTLSNVTGVARGFFWCGNFQDHVDVFIADRPRPDNVACVLHGKKTVNCTYSVYDSLGFNQYNCLFEERNRPTDIQEGECAPPENIPVKQNLSTGEETSTKRMCLYECPSGACQQNISLKIVGWNYINTKTHCHTARLEDIRKPGPVRNLQVHNVTSTSVSVSWTKPDDLNNEDDVYTYTVHWVGEGGEKNSKNITDKTSYLSVDILSLEPGHQYDIKVEARPEKRGFSSDSSNVKAATNESVPASGPIVPVGSYSVQDLRYLGIYWQIMPIEQRRGTLTHYQVVVGSITKTTKGNWTVTDLPETSDDRITVTLRAATEVGYSTRNTTLVISRARIAQQPVIRVNRRNTTIEWRVKDGTAGTVRVHRCYGKQNSSGYEQLVDCKTQIEHRDVNVTTTGHLKWSNPPPPSVSCEKCLWHYAVSVHLNNDTAGMVWNTDSDLEESTDDILTTTLIVVSLLILVSSFLTICILKRKKWKFKYYKIVLPMQIWYLDDSSHSPGEKEQSPETTKTPPQFRDRGIESMKKYDIKPHPNSETGTRIDQNIPLGISALTKCSGDVSPCPGMRLESGEWRESATGSVIEASEEDWGEWLDDNSGGSVVSDYRMQFVSAHGISEEDTGGEKPVDRGDASSSSRNRTAMSLPDEVIWLNQHDISPKSSSCTHSQPDSSSTHSQPDSDPSATSYSEVSGPVLHLSTNQHHPHLKEQTVLHYLEQ